MVECRTDVVGSSEPGDLHEGEVGATVEKGLAESYSEGYVQGPIGDFVINRDDGERVLLTRTYNGRVIQAVVMRDASSLDGTKGWYAESSARCDWAEFPSSDVPEGLTVWTDATGSAAPTTKISSSRGPEHCDWQHLTFLSLDGGQFAKSGVSYVGGDQGDLDGYFDEPYVARTALPPDAVATGYQRSGKALWLSPDRKRAYVGTPDSVEIWPRISRTLGCA